MRVRQRLQCWSPPRPLRSSKTTASLAVVLHRRWYPLFEGSPCFCTSSLPFLRPAKRMSRRDEKHKSRESKGVNLFHYIYINTYLLKFSASNGKAIIIKNTITRHSFVSGFWNELHLSSESNPSTRKFYALLKFV